MLKKNGNTIKSYNFGDVITIQAASKEEALHLVAKQIEKDEKLLSRKFKDDSFKINKLKRE